MSDTKRAGLPLLAGFLLAATPAMADDGQEAEPAVEAEVNATATGMSVHFVAETSLATTYVFRGIPQYNEKTDFSSQTTLGVTLADLGPGSLALGVWNATSLMSYGDQPTTKLELDLTLTYSMNLTENLAASLGYIGYFYPEADPVDGAHEIMATLAFANDLVTPTLCLFAELVRLKGVYAMLDLNRDFTFGAFTISPGAWIALASYEAQDFGLNDINARLRGKWSASNGLYAGATANLAYEGVEGIDAGTTFWAIAFVGFSN